MHFKYLCCILTELFTSIGFSQDKMQNIHTGLQDDTICHNSCSTTNQSVLPTSISLYSVTRNCIRSTLGLKKIPVLFLTHVEVTYKTYTAVIVHKICDVIKQFPDYFSETSTTTTTTPPPPSPPPTSHQCFPSQSSPLALRTTI